MLVARSGEGRDKPLVGTCASYVALPFFTSELVVAPPRFRPPPPILNRGGSGNTGAERKVRPVNCAVTGPIVVVDRDIYKQQPAGEIQVLGWVGD